MITLLFNPIMVLIAIISVLATAATFLCFGLHLISIRRQWQLSIAGPVK